MLSRTRLRRTRPLFGRNVEKRKICKWGEIRVTVFPQGKKKKKGPSREKEGGEKEFLPFLSTKRTYPVPEKRRKKQIFRKKKRT